MTDIDFSAYDKVFKEANQDNLVGKHNFVATKDVVADAWPDGRPRFKVAGMLETANNWKIEVTLSELDTPDAIRDTLDSRIKKGKVLNAQNWMALAKAGLRGDSIKEGDRFAVETYREKPREGYDTGFVRVRRVVGPALAEGDVQKPKGNKDVPF